MIIDIKYTENKYERLESYCDCPVRLEKSKCCFVYFQWDKDYYNSYEFVKYLEEKFQININWIDLSFIYKKFKQRQSINKSMNKLYKDIIKSYIEILEENVNEQM